MNARVGVELSGIREAARTISNVGSVAARATSRGINKVAAKTKTRAKRAISSNVMLTSTYVNKKMTMTKATVATLKAQITGRKRGTTLATYGAKSRKLKAKSPISKLKGFARLGIPVGKKQAGVKVRVLRRGGTKTSTRKFMLPLKGTGGALGVFSRQGGKLKHHYGPSVDQGFALVIDDISGDVATELQATIQKQMQYEVSRGIR
jgi:hypothetical protein